MERGINLFQSPGTSKSFWSCHVVFLLNVTPLIFFSALHLFSWQALLQYCGMELFTDKAGVEEPNHFPTGFGFMLF